MQFITKLVGLIRTLFRGSAEQEPVPTEPDTSSRKLPEVGPCPGRDVEHAPVAERTPLILRKGEVVRMLEQHFGEDVPLEGTSTAEVFRLAWDHNLISTREVTFGKLTYGDHWKRTGA